MVEKIEGIILSVVNYGESSKILNVITKDGIIGLMAKGAKSYKSDLRSVTDKLTYGYFNIYFKENKLSTLVSVDIIDNFRNIKKDIDKISYASFLLELAGQVIKQNQNKYIYEILITSLIKINEGYDPLVITNIVELKFLDFLGVMPVLDKCVKCNSTSSIATLSSKTGGYICNKCLTTEKIVSSKTIKLIRMYYYVDISSINKIDISDLSKAEINHFLDEYYDNYTGLYLKSKEFIKNLNKLKL